MPDQMVESITGHLSRRMMEHHSRIPLKAKGRTGSIWWVDERAHRSRARSSARQRAVPTSDDPGRRRPLERGCVGSTRRPQHQRWPASTFL